MIRDIPALEKTEFDLVVVGAGITGAFLAHDAALRGLKVAIIDKSDFGAATSSASSKLLHGGIRYLQQGRLNKVRESAKERVFFQVIAPHLTRYVPFVVPARKGLSKSHGLLVAGMMAYQLVCFGQNWLIKDAAKRVPGWRRVSADNIESRIPGFDAQGRGGVEFFESHMHSSERMTLAVLQTAVSNGARAANYVQFSDFLMDGQTVIGVRATDLLTGREMNISSRFVINAGGPWIPDINNKNPHAEKTDLLTGYSVGAHVVTKQLTDDCAIALATQSQNQALINRGGRHVFIIPWRGASLIGTSYRSYHGNLDDVHSTDEDIDDLIGDVNSAFGKQLVSKQDVKYTYAGIYPLIDDVNPGVYQGTGDYQIIDHRDDGVEGVVTVFGAKFTTARLLAERSLDAIKNRFNTPLKRCATRVAKTVNGDIGDITNFRRERYERYSSAIERDTIDHLINNYGLAIDKVMSIVLADETMAQKLADDRDVIKAEVVHAARHEMVVSLSDFVFRRTGFGTLGNPGRDALVQCGALLAQELSWDEQRMHEEIAQVQCSFQSTSDTRSLAQAEA